MSSPLDTGSRAGTPVVDWAHSMVVSLTNERAWARHSDLRPWLANCRLNASAAWGQIPGEEVDSREFVTRLATHMRPAIDNLHRLSSHAPSPNSPSPHRGGAAQQMLDCMGLRQDCVGAKYLA